MTHEKLPYLAIIKDLNKLIRKQKDAINVVMELHKPLGWTCKECNKDFRDKDIKRFVKYPCQTIQAIEKELK